MTRILIAEDDLTSRSMLSFIADHWGYQPVLAEDGQEALKIRCGELTTS